MYECGRIHLSTEHGLMDSRSTGSFRRQVNDNFFCHESIEKHCLFIMSQQIAKSQFPVTGTEDLCRFGIQIDLLAMALQLIPQAIIDENGLLTGIFQRPAVLEDRYHSNLRHGLVSHPVHPVWNIQSRK